MNKPDWIKWDEIKVEECPVPAGHDVEVRFRDGDVERNCEPEGWDWHNTKYGHPFDIVAYRDWTVFYESSIHNTLRG